jgi:hypothetical protein
MQTPNDLSRSLTVLKQDSTLIAVIEMSLSSWLVAGIVPGVERQPLKKLAGGRECIAEASQSLAEEAEKAGRKIERIAVAFEAGRDGFWLARWLRARGIEAHVIHSSRSLIRAALAIIKGARLPMPCPRFGAKWRSRQSSSSIAGIGAWPLAATCCDHPPYGPR